MWTNLQETAYLFIFTKEIFNGKLDFLCSVALNNLMSDKFNPLMPGGYIKITQT